MTTKLGNVWLRVCEAWHRAEMNELLRFCLPALILGGIARLALTIQLPYGYFQADSVDFLVTADMLFTEHQFTLHYKKAFLTPLLFTLPFLTKIPVLLVVPAFHHLLGLFLSIVTGALVRAWFARWKWFIVPITVLTTLNPALLWYEHALLSEFHFLFCVTTLALVGTLFVRCPSWPRLIGLIVAFFFTTGSRPEGKLFVAFALLVVALVYFGKWAELLRKMAVLLPACILIWYSSSNSQAGLLLYATVLTLAPDVPKSAPDFGPLINPLRDEYRNEGETWRTYLNHTERVVNEVARDYLRQHHLPSKSQDVGQFCLRLAKEAMLHKPWLLPAIAVHKFQLSCKTSTSGGYSAHWVQTKQYDSFSRDDLVLELSQGLTGEQLRNKTDIVNFVDRHYRPLDPDWFDLLQRSWDAFTLQPGLFGETHRGKPVPGIPFLFLFAAAGMIAASFSPLWRFHVPWLTAFLGVWFVVLLTGVVNPRYRFAYEPFCLIYALLFFDAIWARMTARHRPSTTPLNTHGT